jgi:hypothetical protein
MFNQANWAGRGVPFFSIANSIALFVMAKLISPTMEEI